MKTEQIKFKKNENITNKTVKGKKCPTENTETRGPNEKREIASYRNILKLRRGELRRLRNRRSGRTTLSSTREHCRTFKMREKNA